MEVDEETLRAAPERYPGVPPSLAVARYLLYPANEFPLRPGAAWGGLHLEDIGETAQRLVQELFEGEKVSLAAYAPVGSWPLTRTCLNDNAKGLSSPSGPPCSREG